MYCLSIFRAKLGLLSIFCSLGQANLFAQVSYDNLLVPGQVLAFCYFHRPDRAYPGSEFVVANSLAKWKKL